MVDKYTLTDADKATIEAASLVWDAYQTDVNKADKSHAVKIYGMVGTLVPIIEAADKAGTKVQGRVFAAVGVKDKGLSSRMVSAWYICNAMNKKSGTKVTAELFIAARNGATNVDKDALVAAVNKGEVKDLAGLRSYVTTARQIKADERAAERAAGTKVPGQKSQTKSAAPGTKVPDVPASTPNERAAELGTKVPILASSIASDADALIVKIRKVIADGKMNADASAGLSRLTSAIGEYNAAVKAAGTKVPAGK